MLLQSGDAETLRLWRVLVGESVRYFDEVYFKLDVLLTDGDIVGESFYNPMLAGVVSDLDALGLLVESDGAMLCVPARLHQSKRRSATPHRAEVRRWFRICRHRPGRHFDRVERIGATRILYVVGSPQAQHLEMCFTVAKMAGWLAEPTRAVHVAFGSVLDENRKMFRSRQGDNVKLVDLLDEAVARADASVAERNPELTARATSGGGAHGRRGSHQIRGSFDGSHP